jgi:phenylalanyl-tRNA synthetase alpha chain
MGWAFGLGLERIAMVLFGIQDIRLFWSQDPRFTQQFNAGQITTFKSYSKNPPCYQDISFWLPDASKGFAKFHENDFCEIVRDVAGDLAEETVLVSCFGG